MPRGKDRIPIHIVVAENDHERIAEAAKKAGKSVANYIRDLISADMVGRGESGLIELKHGGSRRGKHVQEEEDT